MRFPDRLGLASALVATESLGSVDSGDAVSPSRSPATNRPGRQSDRGSDSGVATAFVATQTRSRRRRTATRACSTAHLGRSASTWATAALPDKAAVSRAARSTAGFAQREARSSSPQGPPHPACLQECCKHEMAILANLGFWRRLPSRSASRRFQGPRARAAHPGVAYVNGLATRVEPRRFVACRGSRLRGDCCRSVATAATHGRSSRASIGSIGGSGEAVFAVR